MVFRKLTITCSFIAYLFSFALYCGENQAMYYGKSLTQLKQLDKEFKRALDESWWHIVYYRLCLYTLKSPHVDQIEKNIILLKKKIQIIDDCLEDAKEQLKNKINQKGLESQANVYNWVFLLPFVCAEQFSLQRQISKIEKEIAIMVTTRLDIQKTITILEQILLKYEKTMEKSIN